MYMYTFVSGSCPFTDRPPSFLLPSRACHHLILLFLPIIIFFLFSKTYKSIRITQIYKMVRATPEYLAARTSMMSLRAQALEQSMMASQTYYAPPQQPQQPVAANQVNAKDIKPEAFTKPYLEFMTENPTVFHAVGYFKEKLDKAGYKEVSCHSVPAPLPQLKYHDQGTRAETDLAPCYL